MRRRGMQFGIISFILFLCTRLLGLAAQILRPVIHLGAVELTRWPLQLIHQRRPLAVGWVYLFCFGVWTLIGGLVIPVAFRIVAQILLQLPLIQIVVMFFPFHWLPLIGVVIGTFFGLSVAHEIARFWIYIPEELRPYDVGQLHGIHPLMQAGEGDAQPITWDEVVNNEVIFGRKVQK